MKSKLNLAVIAFTSVLATSPAVFAHPGTGLHFHPLPGADQISITSISALAFWTFGVALLTIVLPAAFSRLVSLRKRSSRLVPIRSTK